MNIGASIRSIRKLLSMSQLELAEKCTLSQTSLSQIENGLKAPSQRTIDKVCLALDIPECIIYIFAMEEKDVTPCKKGIFHILYPAMRSLAFKIVSPEDADLIVP